MIDWCLDAILTTLNVLVKTRVRVIKLHSLVFVVVSKEYFVHLLISSLKIVLIGEWIHILKRLKIFDSTSLI